MHASRRRRAGDRLPQARGGHCRPDGSGAGRCRAHQSDVDAVAVTLCPPVSSAPCWWGVSFAKSVAYALDVPLIPVHHVRGTSPPTIWPSGLEPPFLALAISGGNTLIVDVRDYTDMAILGGPRDDAAGEVLRQGGRVRACPTPAASPWTFWPSSPPGGKYTLPRVHVEGAELDMSFSGLKTAVVNPGPQCPAKGRASESLRRWPVTSLKPSATSWSPVPWRPPAAPADAPSWPPEAWPPTPSSGAIWAGLPSGEAAAPAASAAVR